MAKEKVTLTVDTAQLEELRRVAGARSMSSAVEMALAEYLHPVDDPVGIRAGALLGAVRAGSDMAIDAFVFACAELAGGGLIVTHLRGAERNEQPDGQRSRRCRWADG